VSEKLPDEPHAVEGSMSKFCEQCNASIGFFSRKRVTLPDGTRKVFCRACAAQPVTAATSPPPRQPSPVSPAGYRVAAQVQEPSVSGEYELEVLERARRDDPHSEAVLGRLGHLSLRLAERSNDDERATHLKQASNCFRTLLLIQGAATLPSTKAETLVGLATAYELEGNPSKAIAMAARALDVDNSHEPARMMLARLDQA
jgi:hypothetical protein